MEFHYDITIKGSKETIEFKVDRDQRDNDAITGVEFAFNCDDAIKERNSSSGRIEIIIYGKFDGRQETLTAIKQLSDWSKSNSDVYREVTIVLTTAEGEDIGGNFSRTYHFDRMFCIDYFERSGSAMQQESKTGLEFKLFMAQAPTGKISETKAEII